MKSFKKNREQLENYTLTLATHMRSGLYFLVPSYVVFLQIAGALAEEGSSLEEIVKIVNSVTSSDSMGEAGQK